MPVTAPGILPLYLATILIWGSTWYAIEFQLGVVDPALSVSYRFALAGLVLLGWLAVTRQKLLPPRRGVPAILVTGLLTFSLNYLLIYRATGLLPSGLVAVAGSALGLMNILNARLLLGQKLRPRVVLGGGIGVLGVLLLFLPDMRLAADTVTGVGGTAVGFALVMLGNYCASLGNMAVAKARAAQVPLLSATAWGMLLGAGCMAVVALLSGVPFRIDPSPAYLGTLLYLALFGSVAAFLCYFTLIGRVGADRAGYVAVMVPVVALVISTLFEGFQWTWLGAGGVLLALGGNLLVLAPAGRSGA